MTKAEITNEIKNRAEILEWMCDNDIRTYREVAKAISRYAENPDDFLTKMRHPEKKKKQEKHKGKKEREKEKKVEEIPAIQLEKNKKEINEKFKAESSQSLEEEEGEENAT